MNGVDLIKRGRILGFREDLLEHPSLCKRRQLGITVTSNLPIFSKDKTKKDIRSALGEAATARLFAQCKEIEL